MPSYDEPKVVRAWPQLPLAHQASGRGWTVEFLRLKDGRMPALDYLLSQDGNEKRVTDAEFARFDAMFLTMSTNGFGPGGLAPTQFKPFHYQDKGDGLAEFLLKRWAGHRLLCFRRDGQRISLACGFMKDGGETPEQDKRRAREILAEHVRAWEIPRKPGQSRPR